MELLLVTFNLRLIWDDGDGANCFIHRAAMILEKLRSEKPDVICFQEAMPKHMAFLRQNLPEYDFVFNQREADLSGEGLAYAYKRGDFAIYQHSAFWLSDTPFVPGSRFENQSPCPRIVQSAVLQDLRTGKPFRIHNVHLDHIGQEAREKGVGVLLEHICQNQEQWKLPVFVLGDFNASPDSREIRLCGNYDKLPLADTTEDIKLTWHDFGKNLGRGEKGQYKIDYIFTDPETARKPYTAGTWEDVRNGVYLSDHYPVFLRLSR